MAVICSDGAVAAARPLFSRAVQIADAPIELLQSILRCASIALHLVLELTDPSRPLRILCALLRLLCALLRVLYFSLCHRSS